MEVARAFYLQYLSGWLPGPWLRMELWTCQNENICRKSIDSSLDSITWHTSHTSHHLMIKWRPKAIVLLRHQLFQPSSFTFMIAQNSEQLLLLILNKMQTIPKFKSFWLLYWFSSCTTHITVQLCINTCITIRSDLIIVWNRHIYNCEYQWIPFFNSLRSRSNGSHNYKTLIVWESEH